MKADKLSMQIFEPLSAYDLIWCYFNVYVLDIYKVFQDSVFPNFC